jgi:hypothetical protein
MLSRSFSLGLSVLWDDEEERDLVEWFRYWLKLNGEQVNS